MSQQTINNQSTDPYGRPTGDALATVGYPSIWLIFLLYPALSIVNSDAALGSKIIGLVGLVAFAGTYAASWWWTTPLRTRGETANTFLWFAVLCLATLTLIPSIGPRAMSLGPFLIAALAFKLPLRLTLFCVIPLVALFTGLAAWTGPPTTYWVPPMMFGSAFLMLSVSILIDRETQAHEVARELDLARQRESIGRDVHDLLGHSLTVITVKTELARKLVDRDPSRAAAELDEVLALSREALGEVRATVGQLRTPEWSAQLASARTALRAARIDATLPPTAVEIPEHYNALLAWCLREAVTNVIRHSQATHCVVEAGPNHLVITDDGTGPPQDSAHGNGLRGMAERVAEAGGTLRIGPDPAREQHNGTRLEIALP